jgi:sulfite reductase alpha subunit-like flavoprotein
LVVSVVDEDLGAGRKFRGVCSNYLKRLAAAAGAPGEPQHVYAFVKPSTFAMPPLEHTPMIMVGPGTGVAPMRALLQERAWQKRQGARLGQAWLFFGCRRRSEVGGGGRRD